MRTELVDESDIVSGATTFDIEVDTIASVRICILVSDWMHIPVKDCITKWTDTAGTTEEKVPNGVGELLSLGI